MTEGLIKEEDLSAVLDEQAKDGTPRLVGTLLVEMGYALEQDSARALGIPDVQRLSRCSIMILSCSTPV